jgi:AcrR family transcriptional regulator
VKAQPAPRPYHHGDLRRALVSAAEESIRESGPASLNLREIARRVGVSHAAPAHHFHDKMGLLTAVAAEGYRRFEVRLQEAFDRRGSLLDIGVAYVQFAVDERPYFEVMFRPELYHRDDPEVSEPQRAVDRMMFSAVRNTAAAGTPTETDVSVATTAAWALVHGLATLIINGNLSPQVAADPEALTRAVAARLFRGPSGARDE